MSAAPNHPVKVKISYNFPREERLRSKKLISELFKGGSSFNLYPLRFVLLKHTHPAETPAQVLISVSKKYFKKAVDRNRLKRQIREVYRQNKYILQPEGKTIVAVLGIIYIGKEKNAFTVIQKKLISGLERSLSS